MDDALAVQIGKQATLIGNQLAINPNGEYYIPGVDFGDVGQKERLLNRLLLILSADYPEYEWRRSYSLFSPGVTVKWRKL